MKAVKSILVAYATVIYCAANSVCGETMSMIRVVDEASNAVVDAHVYCGIRDGRGSGIGDTDSNGCYQVSAQLHGKVSCEITKEGYYKTRGVLDGAWQSSGSVVLTNRYAVVLKRIIDPVPMVRRHVVSYLPKLEEPIGFDLVEGDWVKPYGKGVLSDLTFLGRMDLRGVDDMYFRLQIEMTNGVDGVVDYTVADSLHAMASSLEPPQVPPATGFVKTIVQEMEKKPGMPWRGTYSENSNYVLRVRAQTNSAGAVVRANYGWTRGGIAFNPLPGNSMMEVVFSYWLNPNSESKSLEADVYSGK